MRQALITRLAEIACHDNFTEMHAFKHHQAIVEEFHTHARAVALAPSRRWGASRGHFLREKHGNL